MLPPADSAGKNPKVSLPLSQGENVHVAAVSFAGNGNQNTNSPAWQTNGNRAANASSNTPFPYPMVANAVGNVPELNLDETMRIKGVWTSIVKEKENVTSAFELRVILGELGFYPSETEIQMIMNCFKSQVNFTDLCRYIRFYKKEYKSSTQTSGGGRGEADAGSLGKVSPQSARPKSKSSEDSDTLKAFVALGGGEDGSGEINAKDLCKACHDFGLTIDMDAMIANVDPHNSGWLSLEAFKELWVTQVSDSSAGYPSMDSQGISALRDKASSLHQLNQLAGSLSNLKQMTSFKTGTANTSAQSQPPPQLGGNFPRTSGPARPLERKDLMVPSRESNQEAARTIQLSSVSEEARLFLLDVYLHPEKLEQMRRAHVSVKLPPPAPQRRRTSATNKLPQLYQSSKGSILGKGRRISQNPNNHNNTNPTNTQALRSGYEDDDGKAGGYQPPSPLILSLRKSTAYKQKRLKDFQELRTASMNSKKGTKGKSTMSSTAPSAMSRGSVHSEAGR